MADDIVVDTNVFMHADNPKSGRQDSARNLLNQIDQNSIPIGIDDAQKIFGEYLEYLAASSLGRNYLTKWFSQGAYVLISAKVPPSDARWIGKNISDTLDKVFLKVATNSQEQDFVSHDFDDFPKRKRRDILARLGVSVQTADEYL